MKTPKRKYKYETWLEYPKARKVKKEDKFVNEQEKRNKKFDF